MTMMSRTGITLTVLGDSKTGSYGASTVSKRPENVASVSHAVGFIRSLGHRHIVFPTDDELAITACKRDVTHVDQRL